MKNLLIYSGHSEVVGGDVKFIVDYINEIPQDLVTVTLYTDKHCHFEKLSKNWLKRNLKIEYLPTRPVIFSEHFPLNLLNALEKFSFFSWFLSFELKGKTVKHIIDYVFRIISLYDLRTAAWNYVLFLYIFSKHSKIDVFLFNNGGYPAKIAGLMACLAARKKRIPRTVMAFHNIPATRRPFSLFDNWLDKIANKSIDKIIAVSEILKKELVSKRKFDLDKIHVIYCGLENVSPIPLEHCKTLCLALGIPLNKKNILITGNLNEKRKGHEFLIHSLGLVKKSFEDFSLLIVGGGSSERIAELQASINQENLQDQTILLGHRFDIHELNSISDIIVVPSIGVEATPYTIKEGYRASKPVITTDQGGCPEGVINEESGFIVEAGNADMLADKILTLLKDDYLREKFGKRGHELFLQKFELKRQTEEINNILLK